MTSLGNLHESHVLDRRIRVLTGHLARLLPADARVLDVGSGDGQLAAALQDARRDVEIQGLDVLARKDAAIPIALFDGSTLPFESASFDVVQLVDVLHHTEDPRVLLDEALRVSRRFVLLKDHRKRGALAGPTLRFMDWVGNARHGVSLPYNYWTEQRWRETFQDSGVELSAWIGDLGLYPSWADWLFGRELHFIARLEKAHVGVTAKS